MGPHYTTVEYELARDMLYVSVINVQHIGQYLFQLDLNGNWKLIWQQQHENLQEKGMGNIELCHEEGVLILEVSPLRQYK